jgi:predicted dehydrogenase
VKTGSLRVSVLGLGAMGLRHVRVLAGMPKLFELVGAFDVSEAARAPDYVRRLSSEADAIRDSDAVVVATPIEAHAHAAAGALKAGRHVLVEKPLCGDTQQAEALVEAHRRGGAHLFVGHSERFNPVVRVLARLLRGDRALAIDLRRVGPTRAIPQGVLLNLGVHDLDLACYLGGGELAVRSAVGSGAHASSEHLAHVLFLTATGGVGHLHVDRTRPVKERAITVVTSRWVYQGDLLAHRLFRTPRAGGSTVEVPLPIEEPLAAQAIAFASAVRGAPVRELATAVEGARAVRLAELAMARVSREPDDAEKLSVLGSP